MRAPDKRVSWLANPPIDLVIILLLGIRDSVSLACQKALVPFATQNGIIIMTNQTPSPIRGWTVVIAAISINLILGVLYAWGVTGKALVAQWHWSKADAALPFTVSTVAFALTMIFAGRAQDKIGPRYVAMLGGIILGAGLILSSFATTPLAMVCSFGVIGGIGIGVGYSATTPPSIKWFSPARKGLITGLVVSGVGLAAVYMSPLTDLSSGPTASPTPFSFWASAPS